MNPVLKLEIVHMKFVYDGLPKSEFADIEHLHKADANCILLAIRSVYKIPFSSDFKPKSKKELESYLKQELELLHKSLLCCNFDGASATSSNIRGAQAKIQQKQPGTTYGWCVAPILSSPRCY